jgi:surfeit locus 1 family protein
MHFKLPEIRVHLFGYLFSPGWIPTLATLLLMPLLLGLGFWQLDRAQQKRILEQQLTQTNIPLTLEQISSYPNVTLRYRRLQVSGHFDNQHLIYLDNKTYQHHPGIHVLTPFIVQGTNKILLVNRGFLPLLDRTHLPFVPTSTQPRNLSGIINFPSKAFLLKKERSATNWPLLIQGLDLKDLELKLQTPLYPFILMQENKDETNLVREWHQVNFPSYRHTGYAFQWFGLALTLIIIYLKLNLRRSP